MTYLDSLELLWRALLVLGVGCGCAFVILAVTKDNTTKRNRRRP